MKWIVYNTVNTVNLKQYTGVHKTENPDVFDGYIGCGVYVTNPSSYMRAQTPFHCAVKKHGPKMFKRSTIKVFDNAKDAYALEEVIVDAEYIKRPDVYNASLGGGGNRRLWPVYQFTHEGLMIKEWDNMQDVADFYFNSHSAIMHAIRNKSSYQGYFWSHETTINIDEFFIYKGGTPVYKYDAETGKFIERYESMVEAAKDNDVLIQQIQNAVKGGYLADKYYYSKELMEEYHGEPKLSIKGKTVYVYDLNGNFITELPTSNDIKTFLNAKHINAVTNAMRIKRPYHGYQLSLEKVDKLEPTTDKKNIKKSVGRYSLSGELLEKYDSVTAAQDVYGCGVRKVLKGQQKQCKGFIFKYI